MSRLSNENTQLLEALTSANLINNDAIQERINEELDSPWYIKIILAFSGWLAAIFIMGLFFAAFSSLFKNIPLLLILGAGLITIAFILFRIKKGDFLEHLAFATSLAGQALLIMGIERALSSNNEAIIWFFMGLLQLILLTIMPNYVHRVISSFVTALSFGVALYHFNYHQGGFFLVYLYGALLLFITALVWINEFRFPKHIEKLQAIGYGLVFALIALTASKVFMTSKLFRFTDTQGIINTWFQPWMGEILLSIVALLVIWKLLQKAYPKPSNSTVLIALITTLIIGLSSTQAQGLMVGIIIILLGFSGGNRILISLGIIALLFFISSYYYQLSSTLLEKSITLLGVGIALLFAYWGLQKFYPKNHDGVIT